MNKGLFVTISGPSGVGKGTIMNLLRERLKNTVFVLSHTTRQPRPGEVDGEQYHFVSKEEFEKGIAAGDFLEWAQVHQKEYYGILRQPVLDALDKGKVIFREIDVQGADSVRKIIPREQLVTIFIKPSNLALLRLHIEKRGHLSEEEILRRLQSAEKELKLAKHFDYQVINYEGQIEACYLEIESIIQSRAESAGLVFNNLKK